MTHSRANWRATLQTDISTWSRETFGSSTPQVLTKLQAEFSELLEATQGTEPDRAEVAKESADVLFMLLQLAENMGYDLLEETQKKFEVNRKRKWKKQPDGTFQHVKE